jgi:hypothetical protein
MAHDYTDAELLRDIAIRKNNKSKELDGRNEFCYLLMRLQNAAEMGMYTYLEYRKISKEDRDELKRRGFCVDVYKSAWGTATFIYWY